MPKHNQRLISILLFITIIGFANYTNADDCFSKQETESVLTELKNEWWTSRVGIRNSTVMAVVLI